MKKILILLTAALIIFSCTDKSNITGNIDNNVVPINKTIDNLEIIVSYSYREEFINKNSTTLVIGKTDTLQTYTLIKFPTIDDSVEWTDAQIILTGSGVDESNHASMDLHAGIVNQNWSESTVSYEYRYTTSDSNYAWEYPFYDDLDISFEFEDQITDSTENLLIDIQNSDATDSLSSETGNFGFVFYSETSDMNYLFYSSESGTSPIMVLKNDAEIIDTLYATSDAFFIPDNAGTDKIDGMKIQNLAPQSVYININFDDSLFLMNGVVTDTVNLKQVAINSAKLVFEVDQSETNMTTSTLNAVAYMVHVEPDTMQVPLEIGTHFTLLSRIKVAEYEPGETEFAVDISPILQHYIANLYTNHGIVIRSTTTSSNFNCIKFDNPKLELIYTNYLENE